MVHVGTAIDTDTDRQDYDRLGRETSRAQFSIFFGGQFMDFET